MRVRVTRPVGVFLIVFGIARLAELADWSRLHGDVVRMLGLGSGTVTALLIAGKGGEVLLTLFAVLALARRRGVWLLVALAGWTADLALLAVVAAVGGDRGRLLEHGLFCLAFAGLLVMTYRGVRSAARESQESAPAHSNTRVLPAQPGVPSQPDPPRPVVRPDTRRPPVQRNAPAPPATHRPPAPPSAPSPYGAPLPTRQRADVTRQDLGPRVTRRDLQAPGQDATRQDLPARRRPPDA